MYGIPSVYDDLGIARPRRKPRIEYKPKRITQKQMGQALTGFTKKWGKTVKQTKERREKTAKKTKRAITKGKTKYKLWKARRKGVVLEFNE